MQPANTPRPRTDAEHRALLRANVQAAAAAGAFGHPGNWRLHHFFVDNSPGDFTPFWPADYVEHRFSFVVDLFSPLAGIFGPDHAQIIAQRGAEAGQ
jgi:hypothetical protein